MKELMGIINASAEKRYANFIHKAADYECAWLLDNGEGYATIDQDGFVNLIVYPSEEAAAYFAQGDEPFCMDIDEFLQNCEAMLEDETVRFAVFPTEQDMFIVSTQQMLDDLQEELENY